METIELSEFHKLFNKDLIGCHIISPNSPILLNIEESNVNVVMFTIENPTSRISKDIANRVVKTLRDTNTLSIKYEYEDYISFHAFCKSDPILKKINTVFNIIKEYRAFDVLLEPIATLSTLEHKEPGKYSTLANPMTVNERRKQYIISKIDETKHIDKDIDIINLFRSEFDFDIKYDYRDTGCLLAYLIHNKMIYEQPTISREEAYDSYINFCNRNYLNTQLNTKVFGIKIKILCDTIHTAINDKRIKKYYLTKFGKSCIDDPEEYYALLKKEEDKNKDPDDICYSESFDKYLKENRDSYKDYTFTKFEAYEDYKDFCKHNSYQPILKKTFYRFMLNDCVVKRSKEKNGSECFILERYACRNFPKSFITNGVPDDYPEEVRQHIQKQIEVIKDKNTMIESIVSDFINYYRDEFMSYGYTRPEAFELYKSYCDINSQCVIGKQTFYKEMQKHCIECRHRSSPNENPKTYFIWATKLPMRNRQFEQFLN